MAARGLFRARGDSCGPARPLGWVLGALGPQPALSPAEQHLESPVPSAPGALAGGPTQAAPGVRGEEEQWAREIGAQLRRMADDLDAQYERRRLEAQQRHRPSPWRVLYNLLLGLLPLPRGRGAPEMEPN
uniref:BCL2 binding component 3 n=1 Tax=Pipistrellus kuhlii TaxID=59472 RepID=A0A7J7S121_PIPKU|nr:BCL2 binding component 3 [Pipistrellus kuhlii]